MHAIQCAVESGAGALHRYDLVVLVTIRLPARVWLNFRSSCSFANVTLVPFYQVAPPRAHPGHFSIGSTAYPLQCPQVFNLFQYTPSSIAG